MKISFRRWRATNFIESMLTMKINGFSELILEAPACHPGVNAYRADFILDTDLSVLFPYINAVAEKVRYYNHIPSIQFDLADQRCAIYPEKVSAGMFENRDQAILYFNKLKDFINNISDRISDLQHDFPQSSTAASLDSQGFTAG